MARPRARSWWRVLVATNAYAAVVAAFNAAFGTNYMYLRQKPESGSLLDLLGPWPWYVLGGEVVAALLLFLLSLPLRRGGGGPRHGTGASSTSAGAVSPARTSTGTRTSP